MAQQHGIIVLFDVENALRTRSLDGNTYWFDNMKFLGSTGEGTGDLVTIVPGTYFLDGSQATEQVLNWLPAALGAIPPTVPRNYLAERERAHDQRTLQQLAALGGEGEASGAELTRLKQRVGRRPRKQAGGRGLTATKLLDVTGSTTTSAAAYNYPAPVITDITGQAVSEKIIYPAQYGSPDMVYDGWYWAATVDTSRPGVYPYTMHVQLHELVEQNNELVWQSVDLTCESSLKITSDPKRNAFTGAGLGVLPLPAFPPAG
ncbi:hypothetical protein Skr01_44170 [Sphaerisporangium krabiense]|uniref:Uncharacterized protein n=1 Tax=Sphaerisporangium krabiense TaxID=763782 RepID=A0A7W8Z0D9_9ACTN|nr:hypothetical protein [Sphaerisporangium krabiense]MBB5625159.1 hypothetical protein [Sphaerisporangium krabiense]GII64332.1 hypothetical protein Skr01_44170 [Sphaerisporangium krabiense]